MPADKLARSPHASKAAPPPAAPSTRALEQRLEAAITEASTRAAPSSLLLSLKSCLVLLRNVGGPGDPKVRERSLALADHALETFELWRNDNRQAR